MLGPGTARRPSGYGPRPGPCPGWCPSGRARGSSEPGGNCPPWPGPARPGPQATVRSRLSPRRGLPGWQHLETKTCLYRVLYCAIVCAIYWRDSEFAVLFSIMLLHCLICTLSICTFALYVQVHFVHTSSSLCNWVQKACTVLKFIINQNIAHQIAQDTLMIKIAHCAYWTYQKLSQVLQKGYITSQYCIILHVLHLIVYNFGKSLPLPGFLQQPGAAAARGCCGVRVPHLLLAAINSTRVLLFIVM